MRAIDLFAGAGGFSTGAVMAGCSVVWAANHWPEAVAVHADNHPHTEHACQDLHQANWSQVPAFDETLHAMLRKLAASPSGPLLSDTVNAARYEWLRVRLLSDDTQGPMICIRDGQDFIGVSDEDADKAIDAARNAADQQA